MQDKSACKTKEYAKQKTALIGHNAVLVLLILVRYGGLGLLGLASLRLACDG